MHLTPGITFAPTDEAARTAPGPFAGQTDALQVLRYALPSSLSRRAIAPQALLEPSMAGSTRSPDQAVLASIVRALVGTGLPSGGGSQVLGARPASAGSTLDTADTPDYLRREATQRAESAQRYPTPHLVFGTDPERRSPFGDMVSDVPGAGTRTVLPDVPEVEERSRRGLGGGPF